MSRLIPLFIILILLAFWVWMLDDMSKNPNVPQNERMYWFIGFAFLIIFAAGYYYFTVYKKD